MEYFDIYNPDGTKTGITKERSLVHRDGDLHAAVHMFIIRDDPDGGHSILFQMRSFHKDSFPGQLDTTSAGHLSAGDDFLTGATRECKEELGLDIGPEDLQFLYDLRIDDDTVFYGKPFRNHELVKVYRLMKSVDIDDLTFDKDEVEYFQWMDMKTAFEKLLARDGDICIFPASYDILYHLFYPDDERHLEDLPAVHN